MMYICDFGRRLVTARKTTYDIGGNFQRDVLSSTYEHRPL